MGDFDVMKVIGLVLGIVVIGVLIKGASGFNTIMTSLSNFTTNLSNVSTGTA